MQMSSKRLKQIEENDGNYYMDFGVETVGKNQHRIIAHKSCYWVAHLPALERASGHGNGLNLEASGRYNDPNRAPSDDKDGNQDNLAPSDDDKKPEEEEVPMHQPSGDDGDASSEEEDEDSDGSS